MLNWLPYSNHTKNCAPGGATKSRRIFTGPFVGLVFIASLLITSCHSNNTLQPVKQQCKKTASLPVKYAKGFSVDYYDGFILVTVRDLIDSSKVDGQYVLKPKAKPMPVGFENAFAIDTPVHKIACVSTSHITEMTILGLVDSIAGVTNVPLIYNETVQAKIARKEIADIGGADVNYERLAELHPSFVTTSGGYDGGDKLKMKLDALKIPSVLDLEYKEQDPLARAEWIKFIAVFYNREYEADSVFKEIEENYNTLKEEAKSVKNGPTVFCNIPFKEIWYMPCGANYISKLIEDAGGDFLWKDAPATNGFNLNLDYETVYNKAANADFWINPGFAACLAEIKAADKKNAFFKAYKTGNIYNNNKRNTPAGGFDFWESGAVNPDKILADLIFIFHPELLPQHQLYYYQKLK